MRHQSTQLTRGRCAPKASRIAGRLKAAGKVLLKILFMMPFVMHRTGGARSLVGVVFARDPSRWSLTGDRREGRDPAQSVQMSSPWTK